MYMKMNKQEWEISSFDLCSAILESGDNILIVIVDHVLLSHHQNGS